MASKRRDLSAWHKLLSGIAVLMLMAVLALCVNRTVHNSLDAPTSGGQAIVVSQGWDCKMESKFITPIKTRYDLADILQQEGLTVGVELGVQYGAFAAHTLKSWPACQRYYVVDLWAQQSNYLDIANVDQDKQDTIFHAAMQRLQPWHDKVVVLRNFTTQAVHDVEEQVDYVYVDARHDYCGALEDIAAWWPKLRPGGIMAGHDYHTAAEVMKLSRQDWSICGDGSVQPSAVVGAVIDFFSKQNAQVVLTYQERSFHTWMVRKPEVVCKKLGGAT